MTNETTETTFEVAPDIEIIGAQPCLYLRAIDAIVIADLHLGYEVVRAEMDGITIPRFQGKQLLETMQAILAALAAQKAKAGTLIILGDIKHEFSETSYHEYREVSDFLDFLARRFQKIIIVKGNHDNFIIRATRKFPNVEVHEDITLGGRGGFYFAHGHRPIDVRRVGASGASWIIIGHEHPAIALRDSLGIKEKVKAFLHGKIGSGGRGLGLGPDSKSKNLIVLPALSPLAYGTAVNETPQRELLSPLLQEHGVDNLSAVGLIEGEECLRFPKIKMIR